MTDSSPADLSPGTVLGDKYRLEREIGRGAMGTVWAALHESLDQRVAIKVISREHAGSDDLRRRFHTEARAAAKLRSRFVVGVYDHGETPSGLPYIVMEHLEGECLEDRIASQGVIATTDAIRVARHIGRALSRAHAHGIVHRDLKPANIFITKSEDEEDGDDWTAKVLDFGIAKMEDFGDRSTTKTGTVLGTPLFMSPEQVRGASRVDSRADLYSLGMVVYNMLTGTYAFEGQSFGDLLVSICTDPLPTLTLNAPHLPEAVNDWFDRACARDPDDRFQSADDMIRALTESIGVPPASEARLSLADVPSGSYSAQPLLAATFAAESTARNGTPQDAAGLLPLGRKPSANGEERRHLDSSNSSAVTVHGEPAGRKRGLVLLGGAAAVAAIALALTLLSESGSAPIDDAAIDAAAQSQGPATVPESQKAVVPEASPEGTAEGGADETLTDSVEAPASEADGPPGLRESDEPTGSKRTASPKSATPSTTVQQHSTNQTVPAPPRVQPRPHPSPAPPPPRQAPASQPSTPDLGF